MKTKAVYALSADPIHFGHLDIIKRAAEHFDLTVLVANNPSKTYMFALDERLDMVEAVVNNSKVLIDALPQKTLTADYAYKNNIPVIIRGVRNLADYDYEKMLRDINISQQNGIETYFLSGNPALNHISSGAVKELFGHAGFIHEYVPLLVKFEMEKKSGVNIIGVTGNIASGKNWFCQSLQKAFPDQIHHIDLDAIGHYVLMSSSFPAHCELRKRIRNYFNIQKDCPNTFTESEKRQLGQIVFSNSEDRVHLNEMMYSSILTEIRNSLIGLTGIVLLNGALLAEFNLTHICNNNVILVSADKSTRHKRMVNRGYTPEQIEQRNSSQYTNDEKRSSILAKIVKNKFGKIMDFVNNENPDFNAEYANIQIHSAFNLF